LPNNLFNNLPNNNNYNYSYYYYYYYYKIEYKYLYCLYTIRTIYNRYNRYNRHLKCNSAMSVETCTILQWRMLPLFQKKTKKSLLKYLSINAETVATKKKIQTQVYACLKHSSNKLKNGCQIL
jgi:hypothetical protein